MELVEFALGLQAGTRSWASGRGFLVSDSTKGSHSRERVAIYLIKKLPQKESNIDNGTGPQRQKDGAFEVSGYMESEVS